jgi:hypothetical protein
MHANGTERWSAIAARMRAEFEETFDANVNNERRKAVEARLRMQFNETLSADAKERFKRQRRELLAAIKTEMAEVFEENLGNAVTEELTRLDNEEATA